MARAKSRKEMIAVVESVVKYSKRVILSRSAACAAILANCVGPNSFRRVNALFTTIVNSIDVPSEEAGVSKSVSARDIHGISLMRVVSFFIESVRGDLSISVCRSIVCSFSPVQWTRCKASVVGSLGVFVFVVHCDVPEREVN